MEVPVVEDDELDDEEDDELEEEDVEVVVVIVVVVDPPQNPGFRFEQEPFPVATVFWVTSKTHASVKGPQIPPETSGVQEPLTGSPFTQVSPQVGVLQ